MTKKPIKQGLLIKRKEQGAGIMVVIAAIACLVLLPLSLLGFEIARYMLMQQQLHNITDAAALAGTGALADAPTGYTYTQTENLAMTVAVQTFEQNSILTTNFSTSNVSANQNSGTNLSASGTAGNAVINITLLDQNGVAQSTGSSTAKVMQIQAYYTDSPIFLPHMLQATEVASAMSSGGLPQLDIILCFDVSGSMDDSTPVYLTRRYWNGSKVAYTDVSSNTTLYNTFGPPATGTRVNAMWPQDLYYGTLASPTNTTQYIFSESSNPSPNDIAGLRADTSQYAAGTLVTEQGMPPGNYDKNNPGSATGHGITANHYANGYTDLVVDIGAAAAGNMVGGFYFPNHYVCLEASRGNLEATGATTWTIFNQSKGGAGAATNASLSGITPSTGYYNAYWRAVQQQAQPIGTAVTAAANFFTTMNISANAHFGLVCFSDSAGANANTTWGTTNNNIDLNYSNGGTSSFPVPMIALNQGATNYTSVLNAVQGTTANYGVAGGSGSLGTLPLGPTGSTDIADALAAAITQLTDNTKVRSTAKKAIILFTDGIPSAPAGNNPPDYGAYAEATTAAGDSIPIYTIGLSTNASIIANENAILGDGNNGSGQGIAYKSGNNAIYIQSNLANLDQAFQAIARALVVIQ